MKGTCEIAVYMGLPEQLSRLNRDAPKKSRKQAVDLLEIIKQIYGRPANDESQRQTH